MTADEIKSNHRLEQYVESLGAKIVGSGNNKVTNVCPMTTHKPGHLCVSINIEKQVWRCNDCGSGGDVIRWMAVSDGVDDGTILKRLGGTPSRPPQVTKKPQPEPKNQTISKIYSYQDWFTNEMYQVVRLEPKSFRQRHKDSQGNWVWNMEGVERLLYRLPEVVKSDVVALCEGEKDAETITELGWCGTCNVGGAGKWLDGYTESLEDKNVLIFGDNDKAGADHVKLVFDSIAGKAKTVKIIKIPEPFKDVTDYVQSFSEQVKAKEAIASLVADAFPFIKGVAMPLYTMAEIEARYQEYSKNLKTQSFNLGKWLPSFNKLRRLIPGELVAIVGDTGSGKTGLLQSIALSALPLPTILFEIELPRELIFERFVSARTKIKTAEVESNYANGDYLGEHFFNVKFPNLFICDDSRLTVENMEAMIVRSELKIGVKPRLVLVDYIQLLSAKGESRYDRASNVAESLKRIAKSTGTIIITASQRGRPKSDEVEVSLHSAKETGSIENSVGLLLGVWRDEEDPTLMHMRVLKSTKGGAGMEIKCNFMGDSMTITERTQSVVSPEDF